MGHAYKAPFDTYSRTHHITRHAIDQLRERGGTALSHMADRHLGNLLDRKIVEGWAGRGAILNDGKPAWLVDLPDSLGDLVALLSDNSAAAADAPPLVVVTVLTGAMVDESFRNRQFVRLPPSHETLPTAPATPTPPSPPLSMPLGTGLAGAALAQVKDAIARAAAPEVVRLAALYAEGKSLKTIGKEMGRSPFWVGTQLRKAGVVLRGHGGGRGRTIAIPPETLANWKALYEGGKGFTEISEKTGVPRSRIYHALKRAGVVMRPAGLPSTLDHRAAGRASGIARRAKASAKRAALPPPVGAPSSARLVTYGSQVEACTTDTLASVLASAQRMGVEAADIRVWKPVMLKLVTRIEVEE